MSNYLTKQGLADLEAELQELVKTRIPGVLEAINKALEEGDISENSSLDSAREEHDKVMARRNEIEEILSDYKLIDDRDRAGSSKVQLGSTVTIMYIHNNMEMTCTIVGSSEANALENKISNESALAKAVLSKKEGDVSEVKLDNATFTVKIIKVNN